MREINLGRVKGDAATINGQNTLTITDGVGITITQNGSSMTITADTDSTPTENSTKPVTSGGVYSAIHGITSGLGTAAALNVATTGNASDTEVVKGNDTRLSDDRNAADVSSWAKAATKPTYNANEIGGLGSSATLDVATEGDATASQVVKGDDSRLTDARNAADVSSWAKASTKPSYDYSEIGNTPSLGTAAALNVATEGDAGNNEVVKGNDSRLTDARNAADVYDWAKAETKPSYNYSEIGNTPTLGTAAPLDVATTGDATTSQVVKGDDSRLTDARNAADVYDWAKASTKPTYSASEVGLGNVGNFKAVSTVASQGLSDQEKANARANIGAGESSFSGSYTDLTDKPTLGTSSALDVATTGDATTSQVVKGDDSRLTDDRNAADVYSWAKASTKPTYTASEVGAIDSTLKGALNGVAELDSTGKVPSSQLPSYVDDVIEGYLNPTDHKFYEEDTYVHEITGTSGKIYVDLTSDNTFRWGGSAFAEISESLALGETSSTAYAGNKGKENADAIAAIKNGSSINTFGGVETALADKVDKVAGKGLSTNDYDAAAVAEVAKVAGKADENQTFTAASTRANIDSGESFATILGKIKKFFTDIADLAFISKDGSDSTKYLRGDGTWQNVPTPENADWAESDSSAASYIKNKPGVETAASGGTTESLVTTGEKDIWNNKIDANGTVANATNAQTAVLAQTIAVDPSDTTGLNIWIETT